MKRHRKTVSGRIVTAMGAVVAFGAGSLLGSATPVGGCEIRCPPDIEEPPIGAYSVDPASIPGFLGVQEIDVQFERDSVVLSYNDDLDGEVVVTYGIVSCATNGGVDFDVCSE